MLATGGPESGRNEFECKRLVAGSVWTIFCRPSPIALVGIPSSTARRIRTPRGEKTFSHGCAIATPSFRDTLLPTPLELLARPGLCRNTPSITCCSALLRSWRFPSSVSSTFCGRSTGWPLRNNSLNAVHPHCCYSGISRVPSAANAAPEAAPAIRRP